MHNLSLLRMQAALEYNTEMPWHFSVCHWWQTAPCGEFKPRKHGGQKYIYGG